MKLSSSQLEAFRAVAEEKSFSVAAERLGVTQSALSQRVAKLEDHLQSRLFFRQGSGLQLTEIGWKVFRYCQQLGSLEGELLDDLQGKKTESFVGCVRIMVKPTLMSPLVLPILTPLLREHPLLDVRFSAETIRSMEMLEREEVDYVITDRVFERPSISSYVLGQEQFVMVESQRHGSPESTFLDLDGDEFLFSLLKREGERLPNVRRRTFADLSSLLEATRQGLGKAILPKQVLAGRDGFKELEAYQPKTFPVVLNFVDHPVTTKTHAAIVDLLVNHSAKYLP